jgi:fructose-bisphosphate aldolase, class I
LRFEAEKFYWDFAGEVPLILKLNDKTDIPSDAEALSPVNATVDDALRLGADAVGYTLYVGTSVQDRDFEQYRRVRADAHRLGTYHFTPQVNVLIWAFEPPSMVSYKLNGIDFVHSQHLGLEH